tara:strand:+ start:40 stop:705 length:666 start_codon:yes stop_codon:yes gene_type:complete
MALPLKDTKINTGLTSLDIGPVSNEYEYINNYLKEHFKDLKPEDMGLPSDYEPGSMLPETDEDDLYNEYGYPKTAFAVPLLGKLGLDFATLKKIWQLNNALEVTGKVGKKVGPILGGIFTSKGAQAKVPPKITRDVGLGDAGIAERIAAQDRAKKKAAIQEAVNIQIGTSRGGQEQSHGSAQGTPSDQPGGQIGGLGGHGPARWAYGGRIDKALGGRSRYL